MKLMCRLFGHSWIIRGFGRYQACGRCGVQDPPVQP